MKLQNLLALLLACLCLGGCRTVSGPSLAGTETEGIDVSEDWSWFRQSVANGNVEATRAGLEKHPEWLKGKKDWTPLHEAAMQGQRRVAQLLVATLHGARPDHLPIDPPCPRHILCLAGESG